ncbi:MAG: F0F1 ATP synthase subunit B [Patescibacteria group bacterium]|nr:F0F1 ATP synthase subunit B [Patescibacteria group bacterium]
MSQFFAAFGLDWKLLLIQAVNFGLLLGALTYFLYKPILRIIDERRKAIEESVVKAQQADKNLADAKTEGEEMIGNAAREAEKLSAAARSRAGEVRDEIIKEAEARAASVIMDAGEQADEAKRRALQESESEIARAAMLAAEKILKEKSA